MIAEKVKTVGGLVRMAKSLVIDYCIHNNYPVIPAVLEDIPGAVAAFNPETISIYISPRLTDRFKYQSPESTAHDIFRLVHHELKHYRQYLSKSKLSWHKKEVEARQYSLKKAEEQMKTHTPEEINPDNKNPVSLYQAFHGVSPIRKRKVFYEPPPNEIIKIGDLSEIKYKPASPSKHAGQEFYHKLGDTGSNVLKTNLILATDKDGKNLYLVKKDKNVKRPYFSAQGIIG